jgi:hypothetical protein
MTAALFFDLADFANLCFLQSCSPNASQIACNAIDVEEPGAPKVVQPQTEQCQCVMRPLESFSDSISRVGILGTVTVAMDHTPPVQDYRLKY